MLRLLCVLFSGYLLGFQQQENSPLGALAEFVDVGVPLHNKPAASPHSTPTKKLLRPANARVTTVSQSATHCQCIYDLS
jgi:hypothetical protein